ncbi:MAG: hypothetical protein AUJ52_05795 [Elusimicrobia bacterium CG1_02_63_36]|nr:MAG: hypothetical protein AUJ52_05795 [Elusimicrobia bacterium CG1_02_63_36]PIP81628.1 MAG: hypothetical protein COR54_19085 [Elusimicrobia bacterium CG22_combo_CG10-13_8_21_14_all_63_91]PJA14239.1 MAG: hypothetical protein COX66_12980 [Elusimicrobia bacterium CG_4_10_14_0_2_um_filter_63_34]PJB24618.1 MAG: hypothetical protein CO113_13015 [Elusimicrobia bacterium CG_4_9_14_3_um_filter_62_55]
MTDPLTGLTVSRDGAVLRLTLNAPPTNALSAQLLASLDAQIASAAEDASIRAVLLESAGGKYFSSGLSLEDLFAKPAHRRVELFQALLQAHRRLAELDKPTVAAVGGRAILGGWILAMACDYRLMDRSGRIALSEVRYGLTPTEILVRRMLSISNRPSAVKELVLRGKTFTAEAARDADFVDRLVAAEDLPGEAIAHARALARSAPAAYGKVKRALRDASGAYADPVWAREMTDFAALLGTAEAAEGLAAMNEKRKPRWEAA